MKTERRPWPEGGETTFVLGGLFSFMGVVIVALYAPWFVAVAVGLVFAWFGVQMLIAYLVFRRFLSRIRKWSK